MSNLMKIGLILILSLVSGKILAIYPNSSIDLTYDGVQYLDHFEASNAHKIVGKLDDAKVAFETGLYNSLITENAVTVVHYTDLDGTIQLQFTGSSNGIVNVSIS